MIDIPGVPTSIRKPGSYIDFDTVSGAKGLPNNRQSLLLIGQRLEAFIEPGRFQGGTLNDLTAAGTFTGNDKKDFIVRISTVAAPDKFEFSVDGGVTWSAETDIVAGPQALADGVTITFAATTGHALADEWQFSAWAEPSKLEASVDNVFGDAEGATYSGYGSIAHRMVMSAFEANLYLDLTVCTLDDAATAQASAGSITFTGPATSPGSIVTKIGKDRIEVGFSSGDTATDVGISVQNELAKFPNLVVMQAVDTATPGKIAITAKNKGTLGDQIVLSCEVSGGGIAAAVVAMSGGTVDPDIDTALAAVFAKQFDITVSAWNDAASFGKLRDHIDLVSGPIEQREGLGLIGVTGSLSEATTLGSVNNNGKMTVAYFRGIGSLGYELVSGFASDMAFVEDPALPLNYREINGIDVPDIADELSRTEQENCLYNGVTPFMPSPSGKAQVVRWISTYVKDGQGIDDDTLLDGTKMRSLFYIRKVMRPLSQKYKKITDRSLKALRTDIFAALIALEELEIVEHVQDYKDRLVVERDAVTAGRANARIPAEVIEGLHVFAAEIQLI